MCMYCQELEKKVAEKNILVIKGTYKSRLGFFSFTSEYQGFIYRRFKLYKSVIDPYLSNHDAAYVLNEGFHSFIEPADKEHTHHNAYFIIPKGAVYYEGGDNAILREPDVRVSDQIIYVGKMNRFNRLLAKIFYKV